jgi:hypothetical protein
MATTKEPKVKKAAAPIHERVKSQLTTAVLKQSISAEELEALRAHIDKLIALR